MTDREKYADEIEGLREIGIPDRIIDHVLSANPSKAVFMVTLWGGLFVMFGAAIGLGGLVWVAGEHRSTANALQAAASEQALLYKASDGIAGLIAFFDGYFASAAVMIWVSGLNPHIAMSNFLYGMLQNKKQGRHLPGNDRLEEAASIQDPDDYLRFVFPNYLRFFVAAALVLSMPAFYAYERDIASYGVLSSSRYTATPWFHWDDTVMLNVSDVTHVELGCGRFGGGRTSPYNKFVYELEFASGRRSNIGNWKPVRGEWLDAIEVLDRSLAEKGASFIRWRAKNALHPKCLAEIRTAYSPADQKRLAKILRLDASLQDTLR